MRLDTFLVVLLTLSGLATFVCGIAQLIGAMHLLCAWSDAAFLLIGISLLTAGWLINFGEAHNRYSN
jgi:uncharacterized membrane protein YphA (DoxX/SURF4 family)